MIDFSKLKKESYGEKDKQIIEGWQNRAIELAEQENFKEHPITIKLAKEAKQYIEIIENRLKNEEDLNETDRKALFREKKVHLIYLTLFSIDPTDEIKQLEKMVNNEI